MCRNLNVKRFRNGDPIREARTAERWLSAARDRRPAWCFFDNFAQHGRIYGKLYNWYAIADPRGLAPEGWRVPDARDWDRLAESVGGTTQAGVKLKSSRGWDWDGHGTDESGFRALPGGCRRETGEFRGIEDDGLWWKDDGFWWTSTPFEGDSAWLRNLAGNSGAIYAYSFDKGSGLSVRCLRDRPDVSFPRDL